MNYLFSAIFGIIQGLTEFLPVSSSGHLVVLHKFFDLHISNESIFDVILHLATVLAVIYFFKKDIISFIKSWFISFKGKHSKESRLSWFIILATIPAALAGYFFEEIIENKLRSVYVVMIMLVLIAIVFVIIEMRKKKDFDIFSLNWIKALFIGFSQILALIPGTSRSGITIIAGMTAGLKREEAIRFSFLLSIPIILGANLQKIPQLFNSGISEEEWKIYIIAFIFSYISGFLTIKYFLKFAKNHTLIPFSFYRILLAILLFIIFV